jgi:hypothetical protein
MKIYFEKIINEERGRKFRVRELDISLPSGERIQKLEDFKESKLKKLKIEEIKD